MMLHRQKPITTKADCLLGSNSKQLNQLMQHHKEQKETFYDNN